MRRLVLVGHRWHEPVVHGEHLGAKRSAEAVVRGGGLEEAALLVRVLAQRLEREQLEMQSTNLWKRIRRSSMLTESTFQMMLRLLNLCMFSKWPLMLMVLRRSSKFV